MQLKHMWREAAPRLDFVETERMNVYILQVMSILRQAYCSPKYLYYLLPEQEKLVRDPDGSLRKEVLVKDIADFEAPVGPRSRGAAQGDRSAAAPAGVRSHFVRSTFRTFQSSPRSLRLQMQATTLPPNRQLDAQRKIRHWYWASVFTNRYSGSVESTAARDFLDVTAWFADDDNEPALLQEFRRRVPRPPSAPGGAAQYVGVQRNLQPSSARRRARLDDGQRPAVR